MSNQRPTLGRGLSALISNNNAISNSLTSSNNQEANAQAVVLLPINEVQPNVHQPRQHYDEEALKELSQSIKNHGVLSPILVRKVEGGGYQIIAGERRWRASKLANLTSIPAIVKQLDNQKTLEISLIENIQREDLTIVEEAETYQRLIKEIGYTQEQLANRLGKSRSHVTNILRILQLPPEVIGYINQGKLSYGHARSLVGVDDPISAANKIIDSKLSVRDAEKLSQELKNRDNYTTNNISKKSPRKAANNPTELGEIATIISEHLGMKVSINAVGEGGKITIHYHSAEQLDSLLHHFS